jgi:hypothetical protein
MDTILSIEVADNHWIKPYNVPTFCVSPASLLELRRDVLDDRPLQSARQRGQFRQVLHLARRRRKLFGIVCQYRLQLVSKASGIVDTFGSAIGRNFFRGCIFAGTSITTFHCFGLDD